MGTSFVGIILIVGLFFVEVCVAATFSSRLIHRFSDEARSIWMARNGGTEPWPERRSIEYARMLLSNDVRRQRLKLGSQNQLLIPSEGSETMFYGNELGWLHYTWIDIGTPNTSFLVALDTGSDLLWVPCECVQCAPLSSRYYYTLDIDLSEYSPSESSTSKHLLCGHHLCKFVSNCPSPTENCPYSVNYLSENTSSSGFLFEDKLHLASAGGPSPQSSLQAAVIIGCGRKQSGSYLDDIAPDGVMGLGPGDISVPSMLAKSGFARHSLSFCFDKTYSGRLFFGDQGPATQESTPFSLFEGKYVTYVVDVKHYCIGNSCVEKTGFQAMVDSGSSFTLLPQETYQKIVVEFDRQVNATRSDIQQFPYCYKARSQDYLHIPSMKLMFSMNQSFAVENPMFHYVETQGVDMYCLGVLPIEGEIGVIGQNFMMGYRMVFDWENLKLGWSHSNCQDETGNDSAHLTKPPNEASPNPLPANERQKAPNRTAVAPAIAGRAPFKSFAGSLIRIQCSSFSLGLLLLFSVCTSF